MRHPDVTYRGRLAEAGGYVVEVVDADGRRSALWGPSAVAWGYHGAGPDQLAYALLLDALGDRGRARECAMWFRWAKVSQWGDTWEVTAREVQEFAAAVERDPDRRRATVRGRRVSDPRSPDLAGGVEMGPPRLMPSAVIVREGGES